MPMFCDLVEFLLVAWLEPRMPETGASASWYALFCIPKLAMRLEVGWPAAVTPISADFLTP